MYSYSLKPGATGITICLLVLRLISWIVMADYQYPPKSPVQKCQTKRAPRHSPTILSFGDGDQCQLSCRLKAVCCWVASTLGQQMLIIQEADCVWKWAVIALCAGMTSCFLLLALVGFMAGSVWYTFTLGTGTVHACRQELQVVGFFSSVLPPSTPLCHFATLRFPVPFNVQWKTVPLQPS